MRTRRSIRLALAAFAALAMAGTAAATATADNARTAAKTPACVTSDVTFTLTEKSQAGGYYEIAAKAKPGIVCSLPGIYPSASFGSAAYTAVSPVEQTVTEDVPLGGSKKAYAGINPKSTNNNDGIEFKSLHISVYGDEENAVTLRLPKAVTVDQPIATNWHADPADAVPFS